MNCEECNVDLLALAYDELDPSEASAARAKVAQCSGCRVELDRLERLQSTLNRWGELEFSPSTSTDEAILRAASARIGVAAVPVQPVESGWWERAVRWLASAALGPQTAMATIMLLAIGIGLYYFPRSHRHEAAATGGTVTEIPEGMDLGASIASETADREGDGVAETATQPAEPIPADSELAPAPSPDIGGATSFGAAGSAPAVRERRRRAATGGRPPLRRARGASAPRAATERVDDADLGQLPRQAPEPDALRQIADRDRQSGRCGRAIPQYESLLRAHPGYSERTAVEVDVAECYQQLGRVSEARRALERASRSPTARPRAQRALIHLERQVAAEAARSESAPARVPSRAADTAASEAAH